MTAPLAKITGHAQTFVAIVFNGFDLIETHRDVLSKALIDLSLTGGSASGLSLLQNVLRELFEMIDRIGKAICVHGYFLTSYERSRKSGYHSNFDRPGRCLDALHENTMEDEGPSKTKIKQEMTALQKLGAEIVTLKNSQIDQLNLPEQLFDAVMEAKRLKSHEAIRRQMQFIGKIMRVIDPESIQQQMDAWNGVNDQETARLHNIENWRKKLLADDTSLSEFLVAHPRCDAQQLRTLIRNTRKEQAENRPPTSYRALFRCLRETLQASPHDDVS